MLQGRNRQVQGRFIASDGSRVVNDPEAETLGADEVEQEQVSVKRTSVRK